MKCNTCQQETYVKHNCPVLGLICAECHHRLSQPTIYEGCVTGEPVTVLAGKYAREFATRSERLLVIARAVCDRPAVEIREYQKGDCFFGTNNQ
jgi:hypothetical protein